MVKREPLGIDGAVLLTPRRFADERGELLEWFRPEWTSTQAGPPIAVRQANCVVTAQGGLRGIHFADVPPGQAKLVTCLSGRVFDVVVDVRVGSPTYGQWEAVILDEVERRCLYLAEGLGHALMAVSESATAVYLCSEPYDPSRERGINPLDPALGIAWPEGLVRVLSSKDASAPTLEEARQAGLLPLYEACVGQYAG
jgi:dTDP-4-dehydrorhamnose 3,5-epimerase